MYLGLSILVVSISFLCYRHPPTTWLFADWLKRSPIEDVVRRGKLPPDATKDDENNGKVKIAQDSEKEVLRAPQIVENGTINESAKVEQDRRMMPPPPPPIFKRPTSPTTPKASTVSKPNSIPSLNLTDGTSSQPPVFPAANSAQRASSSTTSQPPRLAAFPALNSAQRASGGTNAPQRLPAAVVSRSGSTTGGLMPPPTAPRSSLPNRGPPSTQLSTSSLFPPPTHNSIPSKPSKKVQLTPNHSPLDWARLTSSSPSLNGLPPNSPYLRVPPSLLKTMTGRKGKDAWTVLGGKVYNITPYADYHPGGVPELMRAAGRDGTKMFGEVHPWVNWEGMLEGCLVGIAVDEGERRGEGGLDDMD